MFRQFCLARRKKDGNVAPVRVPVATAGQSFGFEEVSMRKGDYAWAVVACLATVTQGRFAQVSVAAAGIDSRAIRLPSAEQAALGKAATQAVCDAAGQAAYDAVEPFGDVANSAQYRRDLIRTLVSRTLAQAAALPAAAKAA